MRKVRPMPDLYALFPTKHRKAFLRAVGVRGRVIRYHSTGEAWDNTEKMQVNARLREAFGAGWIEPFPEAELWPGAHPKTICTYYRLTSAGRAVLGIKDITEEQGNG